MKYSLAVMLLIGAVSTSKAVNLNQKNSLDMQSISLH